MARIFITGSADGLGLLAAKKLIALGHQVVLHARNEKRAAETKIAVPDAKHVLVADLSSLEQTKRLADQANTLGPFDAVIHNAGLYQVSNLEMSAEGFPVMLAVNTLAPYVLTCLMHKPGRLVYLSSGMHLQGDIGLNGLQVDKPTVTYSDSKLHDLILCKAAARLWPAVYCNAVDPGWVPTKMGGAQAPDNLQKGYETQVWLAAGNDSRADVSGFYFHYQKQAPYLQGADDKAVQDTLLAFCQEATGVNFPGN